MGSSITDGTATLSNGEHTLKRLTTESDAIDGYRSRISTHPHDTFIGIFDNDVIDDFKSGLQLFKETDNTFTTYIKATNKIILQKEAEIFDQLRVYGPIISSRSGNNTNIVINDVSVDFGVPTTNSARSSTTGNTIHHHLGRVNNTGPQYYHVNAGLNELPAFSWGGFPGFYCEADGEIRIHSAGLSFTCTLRVDGGFSTFTGCHDTFTPFRKEDIGKIVYSTGNYETEFKDGVKYNKISIMDSCPIVSLTTTENDKRVIGVLSQLRNQQFTGEITDVEYSNLEDKSEYIQSAIDPTVYIKNNTTDIFNRGSYNAIGEGGIWVSNKNGNLENGDYITSSTIPGYGQRQNDDILKNYTVAKITCDCDFTEIVVVTKNHKITDNYYEYDENGNPVYENVLDEQGNETTHLKHELRYLLTDGTQITKEEYSERNDAYIAAFVGCTYHCG